MSYRAWRWRRCLYVQMDEVAFFKFGMLVCVLLLAGVCCMQMNTVLVVFYCRVVVADDFARRTNILVLHLWVSSPPSCFLRLSFAWGTHTPFEPFLAIEWHFPINFLDERKYSLLQSCIASLSREN